MPPRRNNPGPLTAHGIAVKYAQDVVGGKVTACKWTRLACRRHLDDLKRWGDKPPAKRSRKPYWFSPRHAQHAVDFFRSCKHVKGRWARDKLPITLEPWQVFKTVCIFGWRQADGLRRFRTVYLEVARKNAKSTWLAGVMLYLLRADGEEGAEVYSVATTYAQAKIVWAAAKRMCQLDPDLREGMDLWAQTIEFKPTASIFKPLHTKSDSNEGWNTHGAGIDELHAHPTPDMWDVIDQSTGSRDQPLIIAITTAGDDETGICYEQRTYLTHVLTGTLKDESYFGLIYTLDEEDDWQDPAVWVKANPNLGVSVDPENLRTRFLRAKASPRAANTFKTKRLNIWVGAAEAFYDLDAWKGLVDIALHPPETDPAHAWRTALASALAQGAQLYAGLDLAFIRDLAALVFLLKFETGETRTINQLDEDGEPVETEVPDARYVMLPRLYLPTAALDDDRNHMRHQHRGWSDVGHLTLTPGNATDFEVIESDILAARDLAAANNTAIVELAYDPNKAHMLAGRLEAEGITMTAFQQGTKFFDGPMQELDRLIADGKIAHPGNPVFDWMLGNVTAVTRLGGKYVGPAKPKGQDWKKIDGPVATMMALGRAMLATETELPPSISFF